MKIIYIAICLSTLFLTFGCVTKKKYKKQITLYNNLKRNYTSLEQQSEALKKALDLKKLDLKRLRKELADLNSRMSGVNAKLVGETGRRSDLESKLKRTALELSALQKAKMEADRIAKTQRNLMDQFRKMIKAGNLEIINRNGRLIIKLKAAVLFSSGKVKLKKEGQKALKDIATVLAKIEGRHFQIAGHTDNDKVSSRKYKDNWLLSSYRAVNVLRFLQNNGVGGQKLSAAGYGAFQPLKDNTSLENKRFNRRIEIQIIPEIPSFLNQ
jgi:chemotaxis protein MotB